MGKIGAVIKNVMIRFFTFLFIGIAAIIAYAKIKKHINEIKKQKQKQQEQMNVKKGGKLKKDPKTGHYKPDE